MSCEIASMKPCSFLSLILISPVSFLWHLLRSKRLRLADFSILVLVPSCSSSPSLYHWIFIGSWPTKCTLKMALWPTLTVTGSMKSLRSSGPTLGGSLGGKKGGGGGLILTCGCKYIIYLVMSAMFLKYHCYHEIIKVQTSDVDHCLCFTTIRLKSVFPRVLFLAASYD